MKCPSYNLFFETISPRIRVRILELLRKKPMSVSEIVKALNEEQSKISHSLKRLSECHLLDVKQQGKKRIYSLNKDTMLPLMKLVEKHVKRYCCKECRIKGEK
ncbi:metalloregulator ArsR/SmtB family transcription factor [Candidatus Woesearchaeota archaeon]|nr:metalloregulator ArsR/SmtB family transcription factor [Candidatus Woesearchaeota archaeon]